jgi:hypothetical protein
VIFDECLGDLARNAKNAKEFAVDLRNIAYAMTSLDNISTIVVDLRLAPKKVMQTVKSITFLGLDVIPEEAPAPLIPVEDFARARGTSIEYYIRGDYDDGEEWSEVYACNL